MFNTFPNLLTYALFAPLVLRLILSIFLLTTSYKKLKNHDVGFAEGNKMKSLSRGANIVFALSGLLIFVGLFTQVASLIVLILTVVTFVYKGRVLKNLSHKDATLHIFVMAISFSLMLSGAGFYAIDLPL